MSDAATTTTTTNKTTARDLSARPAGPLYAGAGGDGNFPKSDAPRRTPGQTATVVALVVSLIAASLLRSTAIGMQDRGGGGAAGAARRTAGAGASLAGMDSYAIALLLGGLRGPLVMVLWTNSEAQKNTRDLEGVDTQIEWIRLLQPEFDSVHIFQMWNKAYNLSVQTVSLANKYSTILDAVDYGRNVDAERPDNLHIIKELARIYSDKLGSAYPERHYYRARVRKETLHRPDAPDPARKGQPGFQRLTHDPLLDPNGNVLAQYLEPAHARPAGLPADAEFYDGSALQYLKRFEPFPYGVSPLVIGYNYHKRAQVLFSTSKQRHIHLSDSVLDSQPAITLKMWADEEWERGRRLEAKALGQTLPAERFDQEATTAATPLATKPADPSVLPELLHTYKTVIRLADDARAEYERHLANPEYVAKRSLYATHVEGLAAMRSLVSGDDAYVRAMTATGDAERALLAQEASGHYRNAILQYGLITLRYYTDNSVLVSVLPPGVNRTNIGTGPPGSISAVTEDDVLKLLDSTQDALSRRNVRDENAEDRSEYDAYIQRALQRIQQIEGAVQPAAE